MRRKLDSGQWFYHKGGQLHNQKKQNAISEKDRLDKAVKAITKRLATNQISMLSIVSCTKIIKDDIPANFESLHKEDKIEGSEESTSQAEPNDESSTRNSSKRSCEGILPEVMIKASQ